MLEDPGLEPICLRVSIYCVLGSLHTPINSEYLRLGERRDTSINSCDKEMIDVRCCSYLKVPDHVQ